MLIDDLHNEIEELKKLEKFETSLQDAERKEKNDSDYTNLVNGFFVSMKKLSYAINTLNFEITDELIQMAEESVEKLQNVTSYDTVDEDELNSASQLINKKFKQQCNKEWKEFHQRKQDRIFAKIDTIRSFVPDQNEIITIKHNIANASTWDNLQNIEEGKSTRLELFNDSIAEVDHIENNLNLNDEAKKFVSNVSRGKARVTDINQNIIDWIKEANLQDKFIISFKKS